MHHSSGPAQWPLLQGAKQPHGGCLSLSQGVSTIESSQQSVTSVLPVALCLPDNLILYL